MPLEFTTGTSSHPKNTQHKRKFKFKVFFLLHVLIPGVMSSSLETINPWLSACDLKQQEAKGYCAARTQFPATTTPPPDTELLCPKECSPTESKTNASCLAYLNETRRNAICNFNLGNGIEWLKSFLGTIRLRYCCEYKIIESLSSSLLERVLRGKDECFRIIDSLVEVDNLAARLTCEFSEVLNRYDCRQPYSVKFSCNDCLEAYRRWVCSTLVPYYNDSVRIRPCRSVCQAVEQKCPYFLPENRAPSLPTQYAGEPTFLCMDPNIPEVGEQQRRSLYPDDNTCCVKICGSLKDGLCVDKGPKCRTEELLSYEEALDRVVDCSPGDTAGARVPNLECTASEPYSSPHKLGSGAPRPLPRPALLLPLLLSAWLNPHLPLPLPLIPLLPSLPSLPLPLPNLHFDSYKWQYYFILISVNLLLYLNTCNPPPSTTPRFLLDVFTSMKTRRARRYYYYYYYFYRCKHYSRKLSKTAQRSQSFLRTVPSRRRERFDLGESEFSSKRISFRIKNSLTSTRITESSRNYKIVIKVKAGRGAGAGGRRGRGGGGPVGGAPVRARPPAHAPRRHSEEPVAGSASKFEVNHVRRVSRVTSDPKCQFQTLS